MLVRLVLLLSFALLLQAKEKVWYKHFSIELEAAYQFAEFDGSISNGFSSADLRDEFSYKDTAFSYFSLDIQNDYTYAPNVKLSYFNNEEITNSTISKAIKIADGSFDANSTVRTEVNYQVLNALVYETFKAKGKYFRFLKWRPYSGDIDFNVGLNTKLIQWNFLIFDASATDPSYHWIHSDEIILMPYIGFRYYLYRLRLFANASALSLSEAKSTYYEAGADFRVVDTLYLSASYLYEDFKATELKDNINFSTLGYKFGFKYRF